MFIFAIGAVKVDKAFNVSFQRAINHVRQLQVQHRFGNQCAAKSSGDHGDGRDHVYGLMSDTRFEVVMNK